MMNQNEKIRYSRLSMLPGIGEEGILNLNRARILVIGCGALGSVCSMYLAASGIGYLAIADFDTIDISNLQRQIFYKESELGHSKVKSLSDRIQSLNSNISVEVFEELITERRAQELFKSYDFIIDGSDNPSTKLMTSTICEQLDIPYCIGGVKEFSGQVMSWSPGYMGYKELFGTEINCGGFTPCSISGVAGPVAGVVASVQACEAIKFITHTGQMLFNRLYMIDMYKMTSAVIPFV